MKSLINIKNRFNSIESISKLIESVRLISSSKFKLSLMLLKEVSKYLNILHAIKLYIQKQQNIDLITNSFQEKYVNKSSKKMLMIVIGGNEGLSGSFNNKISDYLNQKIDKTTKFNIVTLGNKIDNVIKKRHHHRIIKNYSYNLDSKKTTENIFVLDKILTLAHQNEYYDYKIIYTKFSSGIKQKILAEPIFSNDQDNSMKKIDLNSKLDNDLETTSNKIMENIVKGKLFHCLVNSIVSEYNTRMTTMENAIQNIKELKTKLHKTYHKGRQELITKEILQIITGSEAIKNI